MASTIEKQTWLVDTINRAGRLTFREICDKWQNNTTFNPDGAELALRTFHRYREDIIRVFGIEIKCDKSDNCYYIEDEVNGKEVRSWMLSTIAVDNLLSQSKEIRERIVFEEIPSGQKYLSTLIEAMRENKKVCIVYHSFRKSTGEKVMLEPYFVKVADQRWYVIGPSDVHPDDPHIYALDRIESLEVSAESFRYPKKFNPTEFMMYQYGIYHSNEKPQLIKLKVSKYQCNYMDSLPLHPTQECIEVTPEYNIYSLLLCPNIQFKSHIMSNGADIEVLEPAQLRNEIKQMHKAALEQYGE